MVEKETQKYCIHSLSSFTLKENGMLKDCEGDECKVVQEGQNAIVAKVRNVNAKVEEVKKENKVSI